MPKDDLPTSSTSGRTTGRTRSRSARVKTYDVAVAAFDGAVKAEPYAYIRLSQGAPAHRVAQGEVVEGAVTPTTDRPQRDRVSRIGKSA